MCKQQKLIPTRNISKYFVKSCEINVHSSTMLWFKEAEDYKVDFTEFLSKNLEIKIPYFSHSVNKTFCWASVLPSQASIRFIFFLLRHQIRAFSFQEQLNFQIVFYDKCCVNWNVSQVKLQSLKFRHFSTLRLFSDPAL